MSTSPINNLTSSLLQEILGSSLQGIGLTASPTSAGVSHTPTHSDNGQLSPFAQQLSTLQQLEESSPTNYEQVTAQIATNLQSAAQTAGAERNTSAASQLNQLATVFNNASQSGQVLNLSDLTQAVGASNGHRQHHRDISSSSASSDTSSDANSGSSSSTISTSNSDSISSTQAAVNPSASSTAQTSSPPAGYQDVPFGTGTSVVPTMSTWLAGWSNATDNMSSEAQLNQILQNDYSNNPMFPGGNLPGTNIAADSLTQEQLAAYEQMTGTGQTIGDLQQFLSQYQGANTLGSESYDQA